MRKIKKDLPLKPISPMTVNRWAASMYLLVPPMTLSRRDTSWFLAARCAALSRRTFSSRDSGRLPLPPSGGGDMPGFWRGFRGVAAAAVLAAEAAAGRDDIIVELVWEVADVEEEVAPAEAEAFLMLACGVLEVKRVASATLRGLPILAMYSFVVGYSISRRGAPISDSVFRFRERALGEVDQMFKDATPVPLIGGGMDGSN